MSAIHIYFYLLIISDYEGDVVTLCNIPHVNVGYKYYEGDVVTLCNIPHVNVGYRYLLLFTYDFRL